MFPARLPSALCHLRKPLLGALLSLLLCACGTLSRMPLDSSNEQALRLAQSGDLDREVNELAAPMVESGRTPGLVVGVLTADGHKHFYGYGVRDHDGGGKPDGHTLFAVGSLSKGFLGDIAALLVQDGVLHWDDRLEQLLPAGTPLSDDAKQITLLQLATHTSGLPRQPMTPQTLSYFVEYLFTGNSFYRHFDRDYLLRYMAEFEHPAHPGPQYSNIGYGLLSYVLELHSGQKIDALLQARVAEPLGLSNTDYRAEDLPGFAQRARGHAGDQPKFIRRGQPVPDWQFTDILHGTAALYSNADDLLSYAAANLNGSGNAEMDAALQDTLNVRVDRPQEAAAVAWIVDSVGSQKITYQVGLVAGYTSYIGLDRQHKTAVVVLQNSFNWSNDVGHRLLQRLGGAADARLAGQP
ncbi:serine hydrolase [Pseudomonas sp. GV071]|uniref:serine hydrolase domain-containing protein n=1 Tax=Pseudomonas sp. GV071 TaxID=2135754 RepID=UPI000D40C138|nr:serine hydrolase domain-containing protein [Pseudomonas sp. GV071]PTQ68666.1 CubicO group peptidase (beta-lactamase class C family) [Pseudomonas sp. GV071]